MDIIIKRLDIRNIITSCHNKAATLDQLLGGSFIAKSLVIRILEYMNEGNDLKIEVDENIDDSVVAEESAKDTIKDLREKLKKALAEKQEYLTSWQKDKAEFINARKRDEESKKEFIKYANEGMLSELFPVLDSFNMAMGNKEVWEKVDKNWRMGIEYIANQLKKVLEDHGLKEIDPIGQKFDPMRDEAIEDGKESDIITTVIQKGYSLNGKIVKAPKVKIGEKK
jgi:molecular chaperone GrpE